MRTLLGKILGVASLRFIGVFTNISTSLVLLNYLGAETFGKFSAIIAVSMLTISLFCSPLQTIVLRQMFALNKMMYFNLEFYIAPLFAILILTISFSLFSLNLTLYDNILYGMLITSFCFYVNFILSSYLRGLHQIYTSQMLEQFTRLVLPVVLCVFCIGEVIDTNSFEPFYMYAVLTLFLFSAFVSITAFKYLKKKVFITNQKLLLREYFQLQGFQFSEVGINNLNTILVAYFYSFSDAAAYRVLFLVVTLLNNNSAIISHVINGKILTYQKSGNLQKWISKFTSILQMMLIIQFCIFLLIGDQIITNFVNIDLTLFKLCIYIFLLNSLKDFVILNKVSALMLKKDQIIFHAALLKIILYLMGSVLILIKGFPVFYIIVNFYLSNFLENYYIKYKLTKF